MRLVPRSEELDDTALPADLGFAGHGTEPTGKDAARQWARLHRRMQILGTNLSALKARPIKSKDVEDQIRDTTQQLESLSSELRSLGTRDGS